MSKKKINIKGTPKQDLVAARAELKAFRHEVALLKRKGLLDKKYDARKVMPTKYLKSQIKQFANVLSGKAQVAKVTTANKKYYADLGYTTKANRVIVPVHENETVYSTHGDFRIKTTGSNGSITTINLKVPRDDILKWADAMKKQHVKLKNNEQLALQLYGYNLSRTTDNLKHLIEFLEAYKSFEELINNPDHHRHQTYIKNIVIYKIERGTIVPKHVDPEVEERAKRNRALRHQRWLDRMTPQQEAKYLEQRAEIARKQRANIKRDSDPTRYLEMKERARARAKKSYENKKGKK